MAMPFLDLMSKKITKHRKEAALEVEHLLRQGAYASRTDLQWQTCFRLPGWAEGNPLTFFQASERHERVGGYWAFVVRCTLPRALSRDAQVALAIQFLAVGLAGFPGLVVLHEPMASDGLPQPHCHFLYSSRCVDTYERSSAQFFSRYDSAHPMRGGARKDERVTKRQYPSTLHTTWCELMEEALKMEEVTQPMLLEEKAPSVASPEDDASPLSIAQSLSHRAAGLRHLFARGRKE